MTPLDPSDEALLRQFVADPLVQSLAARLGGFPALLSELERACLLPSQDAFGSPAEGGRTCSRARCGEGAANP